MDLAQLRELLRIVAESDVAEVEVEQEGVKIVVRKNVPTLTVQPAAPPFPGFGMGYYPSPYAPAQSVPSAPPSATAAPAPDGGAAMPSDATAIAANTAPASEAQATEAALAAGETVVKAPIVGTFYRSPSPDTESFVNVGDRVNTGDVLCIIEAMKLMNEIESEISGIVRQVLVENAQPVEFDQPLFVIEKA
ncbi:MAG TPA: acetyl-CoA carboxylase biotin carboxyl carrier protein [Rhodothermales bacterium]|nr:acetyl-CoA carboxylase biotin carboxyl carrier protein [Rhodothermales bacterium]